MNNLCSLLGCNFLVSFLMRIILLFRPVADPFNQQPASFFPACPLDAGALHFSANNTRMSRPELIPIILIVYQGIATQHEALMNSRPPFLSPASMLQLPHP